MPAISRRTVASTLAVGAGIAASPAAALREVDGGPWAEEMANSCADERRFHLALIEAALEEAGVEAGPEERHALLSALECPRCGCALLAADFNLPER